MQIIKIIIDKSFFIYYFVLATYAYHFDPLFLTKDNKVTKANKQY